MEMFQAAEIGHMDPDDIGMGSRELNRMLEDIKLFVPTIVGLVAGEELFRFKQTADYGSVTIQLSNIRDGEWCAWEMDVSRFPRRKHDDHERADIDKVEFRYDGNAWYRYNRSGMSTSYPDILPSMGRIAMVYRHRKDFLDAMLSTFPSVRKGVIPLIQAASLVKR